MLLLNLLSLQCREPLQPEIQDRLRLTLGELESLHQVLACGLYGTALADDRHYLVQVGERYEQSFEDVRPRLGPLELVARPAGDHLELVGDVVLKDLPVRERTGYAVHKRHQVHAEALLHLGVLVEVVQHDLGHRLAFELDDDAHPVAVGLVSQVGDVGELAVLDQLGDLLQEVALVHLVRDLGDHDLDPVPLYLLGVGPRLHPHRTASSLNGVPDTAQPDDHTPCREVRPLDVLRDLGVVEVRVVSERHRLVLDLAAVVWRDLGCHPDRDAVGAIYEQVGEPGRQDLGLALALVEVRDEVDRVGAYVPEHLGRHPHQACLGVAHGGRRITVNTPEVPLAVHQRVAHREVLCQPGERVVDRRVAVRVVFTDDLADDRRALAVRPVRLEAEVVHSVEHAPVDWLEAVPHVRQGARDDNAHRVGKERVLYLVFYGVGPYVPRESIKHPGSSPLWRSPR